MGYAENNLRKDEKILLKGKVAWVALAPSILLALLLLALAIALPIVMVVVFNKTGYMDYIKDHPFMIVSLILPAVLLAFVLLLVVVTKVLRPLIQGLTTSLTLTDKRVIGKQGLLKVASLDYPIEKVSSVGIRQSFFGKIFGYSDVTISSVNETIVFHMINNGPKFKNAVTDAVDERNKVLQRSQAEEIAKAISSANKEK